MHINMYHKLYSRLIYYIKYINTQVYTYIINSIVEYIFMIFSVINTQIYIYIIHSVIDIYIYYTLYNTHIYIYT